MVRLNFLTRKQNDANAEGSTCSGIIFHENYIMTAAHCCKGKFIVHVHFNDHSRSVEDKDEKKLTIFKSQERLIFIPKTSHSGFCPRLFHSKFIFVSNLGIPGIQPFVSYMKFYIPGLGIDITF